MPIFGYGATMALFAYIYIFIAAKPQKGIYHEHDQHYPHLQTHERSGT